MSLSDRGHTSPALSHPNRTGKPIAPILLDHLSVRGSAPDRQKAARGIRDYDTFHNLLSRSLALLPQPPPPPHYFSAAFYRHKLYSAARTFAWTVGSALSSARRAMARNGSQWLPN